MTLSGLESETADIVAVTTLLVALGLIVAVLGHYGRIKGE
jgi:hypothetical protein